MVVVALDPGHGGNNVGCEVGDFVEKDANLDLALNVEHLFRESDKVELAYSRFYDEHLSLKGRAKMAEAQGADCAVVVHHNAALNHNLGGTEIYCQKGIALSRSVGEVCRHFLPHELGSPRVIDAYDGPGAKDDWKERPQSVLDPYQDLGIPAILWEVGYVTNARDYKFLSSKYAPLQLSIALSRVIVEFAKQINP